jgi:hypothetical protein
MADRGHGTGGVRLSRHTSALSGTTRLEISVIAPTVAAIGQAHAQRPVCYALAITWIYPEPFTRAGEKRRYIWTPTPRIRAADDGDPKEDLSFGATTTPPRAGDERARPHPHHE